MLISRKRVPSHPFLLNGMLLYRTSGNFQVSRSSTFIRLILVFSHQFHLHKSEGTSITKGSLIMSKVKDYLKCINCLCAPTLNMSLRYEISTLCSYQCSSFVPSSISVWNHLPHDALHTHSAYSFNSHIAPFSL